MFLKLVCVMLVWRWAAADELLDALEGVHGGNRMVVCAGVDEARAGGPARCPGVLWRRQWALARASCLVGANKLLVLRDAEGLDCEDSESGKKLSYIASRVRARIPHPGFRVVSSGVNDLVLLGLERGYVGDEVANTSSAHNVLVRFEPWLNEVYNTYPMGSLYLPFPPHTSIMFSTPLRMFMTTVLLPIASFMVFFVYVIFYTGLKERIPYQSFNQDKEKQSEGADNTDEADKTEDIGKNEESFTFEDQCGLVDQMELLKDYEDELPWGVRNPWGI